MMYRANLNMLTGALLLVLFCSYGRAQGAGSLTRSGVLSHIASGGGWATQILLSNTSATSVSVSLLWHAEDGTALVLPLTVTLQGKTQSFTASSYTASINTNATVLISIGNQSTTTSVGWTDVLSSGPVNGFSIFQYKGATGTLSEGTVSLSTQFPPKILVPYDNTNGFSTGVALVNLSPVGLTITATMWDPNGSPLGTQLIALAGSGHTSFFFTDKLSPTTNTQGFVTFQTTGSGGLAAVGLRFSPLGTFTSVPTSPVQ